MNNSMKTTTISMKNVKDGKVFNNVIWKEATKEEQEKAFNVIGRVKQLLLLIAILLASCNKNCDAELQRINEQYASAMSNAGQSQSARNEITRQYHDKVNDLNCD